MTRASLEKLLGPQGPLAAMWPGYEPRAGQMSMALEVARAFAEDDFALVEAGTGTGKTLAYLLPALMSGKKTIVSTGLKNLQDQIFEKDLPFIRQYFGDNFRAALLKGRENYLCLFYLKRILAQSALFPGLETDIFRAVAKEAPLTARGDRAEFAVATDDSLWSQISAPADRCLGQRCPEFSDCYLWKARKEAAAADLVLVNHHLFMADLAIRASGYGEVLPEWDAAVFDEAHLLEEAATSYFGRSLSSIALTSLSRDLVRCLAGLSSTTASPLMGLAEIFQRQADALSMSFFPKRSGEWELWTEVNQESIRLKEYLINFHRDAQALLERLKGPAKENDALAPLLSRLAIAGADMLFLSEGSDRQYVYQAERQGRRLTLSAFPVKVSRQLSEGLLKPGRTLIFTSATLSQGGDFSYFKDRIGLWPELEGLSIDSPFDYASRTLIYLPTHLPPPTEVDFSYYAAAEVEQLINLSRGRALVLFTSHKNMNFVAEALKGKVKWPILVQGEKSRGAILDDFKKQTSSVLLATHSFWQGVDVPGESLSAVIIEKLPFPRPDRPLVKARGLLMEEEGKDQFMDYFIPEAALTLKQGLGRLMRQDRDQGLLSILDVRILKKAYGKKLLKTLPPSRQSSDINEVAEFLKKI